jgi:hypothetical protein
MLLKKTTYIAAVALAGLLSVSTVRASHCEINLPDTPVLVSTERGTHSFFEITLTGVGAGYTVQDGVVYTGWCASQPLENPSGLTVAAYLASVTSGNLPAHWQLAAWDKILWILNNKRGTAEDIQGALWFFFEGTTNDLTLTAIDIIADALVHGQGFVPGPGQVSAVVIDWVVQDGKLQLPIIEVPCPPKDKDRVSDRITGGGWITTPTGGRGNFGVQGGIHKGRLWGGINYIDHDLRLHVHGRTVTNYEVIDANCRRITYEVRINREPGTAVVVACDYGEPGRDDVFQITLSTGYTAGGTLEGGGNIQLHTQSGTGGGASAASKAAAREASKAAKDAEKAVKQAEKAAKAAEKAAQSADKGKGKKK